MNTHRAEEVLYSWACNNMSTAEAKSTLRKLGYDVDFRQPDLGHRMEAIEIATGEIVCLEI